MPKSCTNLDKTKAISDRFALVISYAGKNLNGFRANSDSNVQRTWELNVTARLTLKALFPHVCGNTLFDFRSLMIARIFLFRFACGVKVCVTSRFLVL